MIWRTLGIAALFGGFQAAMPLAGYLAGSVLAGYILSVGRWVAVALLVLLGVNMIWRAYREGKSDTDACPPRVSGFLVLLLLALATSVDALAVGVAFSLSGTANILPAALLIGGITFVISLGGVCTGHRVSYRHAKKAAFFGGGVLILLGVKMLVEHLF